jgi:hypothetical protein
VSNSNYYQLQTTSHPFAIHFAFLLLLLLWLGDANRMTRMKSSKQQQADKDWGLMIWILILDQQEDIEEYGYAPWGLLRMDLLLCMVHASDVY